MKTKRQSLKGLDNKPGPCCTKLTIDGNFAINGNYHGNLDFDWLLSPVTMVVTIDDKVTINWSFMQQGPGDMFISTDDESSDNLHIIYLKKKELFL